MNAVIHNTIPNPRLAIHELSALVARHNGRMTDPNLCFPDVLPPPTPDLETEIVAMKAQGYTVGDPVRITPSRRTGHAEFHLSIASAGYFGVLAFHVKETTC